MQVSENLTIIMTENKRGHNETNNIIKLGCLICVTKYSKISQVLLFSLLLQQAYKMCRNKHINKIELSSETMLLSLNSG